MTILNTVLPTWIGEHSKYVRATVSRLNYLLSDESDRHGSIIQLLNHLGEPEEEKAG